MLENVNIAGVHSLANNQVVIVLKDEDTTQAVFSSYGVTVATVTVYANGEKKVVLDGSATEYSRTTSKWLYRFLARYAKNDGEDEYNKKLLAALLWREREVYSNKRRIIFASANLNK